MSLTSLWSPYAFATASRCASCRAGVPNLAALHFQSLTPVSSSLPSADHLDLSIVRVFTPMSLLAGRGVLLCSTSGRPVLPSTIRIGVYVVLHLLCGDWPSLWSNGPTMFLRVPTWHSWPLMLSHRSIASGCFYRWSLRSVFLHVTALLAHHCWRQLHRGASKVYSFYWDKKSYVIKYLSDSWYQIFYSGDTAKYYTNIRLRIKNPEQFDLGTAQKPHLMEEDRQHLEKGKDRAIPEQSSEQSEGKEESLGESSQDVEEDIFIG